MSKITRRAALAAMPAFGLAPIVPAMAEPVMTPLDKVIWHMREIDRIARETGSPSSCVMVLTVGPDELPRLSTLGWDGIFKPDPDGAFVAA